MQTWVVMGVIKVVLYRSSRSRSQGAEFTHLTSNFRACCQCLSIHHFTQIWAFLICFLFPFIVT